jgi:ribokinase
VDAVDTVGAGDCFTAALSIGIFENSATPEALRFALAAAALAVTKHGAQDAMPRRAEVDALLRQEDVVQ